MGNKAIDRAIEYCSQQEKLFEALKLDATLLIIMQRAFEEMKEPDSEKTKPITKEHIDNLKSGRDMEDDICVLDMDKQYKGDK